MKRTIATLGVVGLGLLGATVSANAAPSDKITICHATHSASNPYVAVTISLSALSTHVLDTKDIVPANSGAFMPNGQNLTPENIAILNAGCRVASSPPTNPPVTSPPTDPVTDPPVTSPPTDPVTDPPVTTPPTNPPVTTPPTNPPVTTPPTDPVTDPPVTTPPTNPPKKPPVTTPPTDPVTTPPVTSPPTEQAAPVTTPPVVAPVVPRVASPAAPAPAAVTASATVAAAAPDPSITNVGYNVQTAVGGKADTGIPGWLVGLTGLFSAVAVLVVTRSAVRARKARH